MLYSSVAKFCQFWEDEQLLTDDFIQRVGDPGLVLRPAGRGGRASTWSDIDFVDGPSEFSACCAVRVAGSCSQVPRRVDGLGGEGLGTPSPHVGCHVVRRLAMQCAAAGLRKQWLLLPR